MEPVGDQQHQGDIGKAAADSGQGVEREQLPEGSTATDQQEGHADQQQACSNGSAGLDTPEGRRHQQYREQITGEVTGADVASLARAMTQP